MIVVGEAKYSSFLCSSLGRASSSSAIRARAGGKRYRTLVPPTFLEERKEREAIANGRGEEREEGREGAAAIMAELICVQRPLLLLL